MTKKDWKDQLKDVKVPEKVTELRNKDEITRAVQFTEAELETHLDPENSDVTASPSKTLLVQALLKIVRSIGLGEKNQELSRTIDEFIQTVAELDEASDDLASGAKAQAAEYWEELERLQANLDLDVVLHQLEIRNKENERVRPVHEELSDQEEELNDKISSLNKQLAVPGCEKAHEKRVQKQQLEQALAKVRISLVPLSQTMKENRQAIEQLITHENAVRIVKDGLPKNLLRDKFPR